MIDEHEAPETQSAEAFELHPEPEQQNVRLDRFITDCIPGLSRASVQTLIADGRVLVDGLRRKASFKVTPGEVISVMVPPVAPEEIEPENIPLDVLYEDDDVIVINKAAGMVVHPAAGHASGTLVNALRYHWDEISEHGTERSGIVHRLDKDTSGVMIVGKHNAAMQALQDQWLQGQVGKRYVALANGIVAEEEAVIDVPIARDRADRKRMAVDRDGRNALTIVTVRERLNGATLLDIDLRTGRTHQIRVHLAFIKHPILGDMVYGTSSAKELSRKLGIRRQQLHAAELTLALPSGGEPVTFAAPVAEDMISVFDVLRDEERTNG